MHYNSIWLVLKTKFSYLSKNFFLRILRIIFGVSAEREMRGLMDEVDGGETTFDVYHNQESASREP